MTGHNKNNKAIGIYGGTFDPVHYGHLRPVLESCEKLGLKHIRFIPSYIPPHRQAPDIRVNMRLEMLEKAIAGESRFVIDTREIQRQGNSYMIDTLISLKEEFPETPLCLILGLDAFLEITGWHRWNELLSYCHLVVTRRPETEYEIMSHWPDEVKHFYQQHMTENPQQLHITQSGLIYFIEVIQLPISSSLIRHKIKNNLSVRYLLPDEVYDIIADNKLYL